MGTIKIEEEIKNKFIELAIQHGNAIEQGDDKVANKIYSELNRLLKKIKKKILWHILYEISQHKNDSVKLWAGSFLLGFDESFGLSILNEVKKSEKIIGLLAETIIEVHNSGMT